MNKIIVGLLVAAVLGTLAYFGIEGAKEARRHRPTVTDETEQERDESMRSAFAPSADGSKATAVSGDAELEAELLRFFQQLGKAFSRGDRKKLLDLFSVEGLYTYAEKSGLIDLSELNPLERRKFRTEFIRGLKKGLVANAKSSGFSNPRVMRIEKIRDGEVIAYVRSYSDLLEVNLKMRYWLLKNADGQWQLYDHEDLEQSLRTSALMGAILTPGGDVVPWTLDLLTVVKGISGLGGDDPEGAFDQIGDGANKLLKYKLPSDIEAFALSMRASVLSADGKIEAALADIERLEKLQPGAPGTAYQRGGCFLAEGKYEEAIGEYKKYVEVLGWDSDLHAAVSDCHYQLGEMEECLEHAEKGLADSPKSFDCLAYFALAAPEGRRAEISERVKLTGEPEFAYETIIEYAIAVEANDVRDQVLAMLEADFPRSELIEYYKGRIGEE